MKKQTQNKNKRNADMANELMVFRLILQKFIRRRVFYLLYKCYLHQLNKCLSLCIYLSDGNYVIN